MVRQEAAQLHDRRALELVETAAKGVDGLLQNAARKVLNSHRYLTVLIKGKAQTRDVFSSDWYGKAVGASYTYDGVIINNNRKAFIGNKYGGKNFWDN